MNEPIKKLILTREYKGVGMYTCPYCKIVCTPLDFTDNAPWCETGYRCPMCHSEVLPHRTMKK